MFGTLRSSQSTRPAYSDFKCSALDYSAFPTAAPKILCVHAKNANAKQVFYDCNFYSSSFCVFFVFFFKLTFTIKYFLRRLNYPFHCQKNAPSKRSEEANSKKTSTLFFVSKYSLWDLLGCQDKWPLLTKCLYAGVGNKD